jgi:excisionase family DNA binding protein
MPCGMNNPIQKLFLKLFPAKPEKLCYSIAEVSDMLHMSELDIYAKIKQNKIRAIQIEKGGNYRISREEVKRLKNSNGRV